MIKDVSIVVPFYNEEEACRGVLEEIVELHPDAEIIAINDGSTDSTWDIISSIDGVTGLNMPCNRGQSAAMYAGLKNAQRPICVLMDGDGQNDPADIPLLIEKLNDESVDVVCGYRAERKDTASRRYASKIANKIRRSFIHDGVRDTGCSLKAFRTEAVDHLVPFNGMHRYIPALMLQAGMKISQVAVNHRERSAGESKYTNWERALRGIYDLIGVSWLLKRKVLFNIGERKEPRP